MVLPLYEQPWPEGEYRFFQLGFIVDDIDEAAGRWAATFGVGPFRVQPGGPLKYVAGGVESTIDLQTAVAQAGPVQIELIRQRDRTPSIFLDHHEKFGGGAALHQVSTITADFDAKVAQYRDQGYEIAADVYSPGFHLAFVDTLADFGFYVELVDGPAQFIEGPAAVAASCARWDGVTAPVRYPR